MYIYGVIASMLRALLKTVLLPHHLSIKSVYNAIQCGEHGKHCSQWYSAARSLTGDSRQPQLIVVNLVSATMSLDHPCVVRQIFGLPLSHVQNMALCKMNGPFIRMTSDRNHN